jgi:hypothetical protein
MPIVGCFRKGGGRKRTEDGGRRTEEFWEFWEDFMGRSRRQKQRFDCGHRGFGLICHRCADVRRVQERDEALQQSLKQVWLGTFEQDTIDLRGLPRPIVVKARWIMQALAEGVDYRQFRGKRLQLARSVIRIPVGDRYRLICDWLNDQWVPRVILSHEAYNPMVRSKNRL